MLQWLAEARGNTSQAKIAKQSASRKAPTPQSKVRAGGHL